MNRTTCRLLDIQELLSDGGVGRHQHVLVSQGQIGSVLIARPDEHRAVIEEAAGITKYKVRKIEALRKLERTENDLVRLADRIAERNDTAGVQQDERMARPIRGLGDAVAGHAGRFVHDSSPLTEDPVEERRLAHVGATDDGYRSQRQSFNLPIVRPQSTSVA